MQRVGDQLTSLRASVTTQDISTSSLACEHRALVGVDANIIDTRNNLILGGTVGVQ